MKNKQEPAIIADAINKWIVVHLPQQCSNSVNTQRAYTNALALFIQFLESQKGITYAMLSSSCFTATFIQEWMLWLKNERKCSNATCNHRLACMRSFLKFLSHQDLRFISLEYDSKDIKRMKEPKRGILEITKKAMKTFFGVIDLGTTIGRRDFALFSLLYNTATRINELLSLTIGDLHLEEEGNKNYVTVWGKGSKLRNIYLLPEVVKIIRRYIRLFHGETPEKECLLFFSMYGGSKHKLTQECVNKRLKLYASLAHAKCPEMPENIHCHNLRSARATHWLEEELNVLMIQKLLGHENISTTTKSYVAVSNAQKAKALANLEDDVAKNAAKKWKKVKRTGTLAEILGLK